MVKQTKGFANIIKYSNDGVIIPDVILKNDVDMIRTSLSPHRAKIVDEALRITDMLKTMPELRLNGCSMRLSNDDEEKLKRAGVTIQELFENGHINKKGDLCGMPAISEAASLAGNCRER